jgi:putative heme-binding domain-containing protein
MRAAIAVARRGSDADAAAALQAVEGVLDDADEHDRTTTIVALRAAQLCFLRHPSLAHDPALTAIADHAVKLGAGTDAAIAEDALALGCALDRGDAVPVGLARMERATDRADAMRWATMLRTVNNGWDDGLRARYWAWLDAANAGSGGFSLQGFLDQIRREAAEHVKRPAGSAAPAAQQAAKPAALPMPPTGATLHAWTVDELAAADPAAPAADLANGARVFRESACILCHRFGGDGGSTGPDLSGVGGRFARADLLRALLDPSADVSDQYRDRAIETKDGSVVVGRIVNDAPDFIEVGTNPVGQERDRVAKADIVKIEVIPTSAMPKGLLDARTRREVEDLLAYLARGPRGG